MEGSTEWGTVKHPAGSASCACVYPVSVNGTEAGYYTPLANDQDWAMYFMLRYIEENCR